MSSFSLRQGSSGFCQFANFCLVVLGSAALLLSVLQFTKWGLDNYRLIDLRLLNSFHILTGVVGLYCVQRCHGSIVVKTLYIVSVVIAAGSAMFYAFTTYRVVDSYQQMSMLELQRGFTAGLGWSTQYFPAKIAVAGAMTLVAVLTTLTAITALFSLERLVMVERQWSPSDHASHSQHKQNRSIVTALALLRLVLAVITISLAVFVEFQHQLLGGRDNYIRLALDHIGALLVVASSLTDLYAVFNRSHPTLNFKVSAALGVVAATWCLKSVDNNAFPTYRNDLIAHRLAISLNQFSAPIARTYPQYAIVVAHACLIGLLALLFLLSAVSAIAAVSCLRRTYPTTVSIVSSTSPVDLKLIDRYRHGLGEGRFLGALHLLWTVCLLILAAMGLFRLPWNGDFAGVDLFWLAVLFLAGALLGSSNKSASLVIKLVMSVCCLGVGVEKLLASVNLIYQSAAYADYRNLNVTDWRTYTGQIVLHSCQTLVLFGATMTSLGGVFLFGRRLHRREEQQQRGSRRNSHHTNLTLCCFSLGALFYGVVMSLCYLLFEFGKWRYSEVPLEQPFFRLGNGPLAMIIFVVQALAGCGGPNNSLLLPATLLQLILSTISLFTLSSAATNLYYMQIIIQLREQIGMGDAERIILVIAAVLACLAVIACVVCIVAGIICILRASYILHHRRRPNHHSSVLSVSPAVEVRAVSYGGGGGGGSRESFQVARDFSTPTSFAQQYSPRPGRNAVGGREQFSPISLQKEDPAVHQISIQPVEEEQTLYWSAEENPYIYKSTKRYLEPTHEQHHYLQRNGYDNTPSLVATPKNGSRLRRHVYENTAYVRDDLSPIDGNGNGKRHYASPTGAHVFRQ